MQFRLSFRRLLFFKALAETASFTAAAQRCGVSQPGLSAAIRELEDELGVRLFQRDTRNVRLTPEGEALLPLVEITLNNAEQAAHDIQDLIQARRNNVRVIVVSSIASFLLPAVLPDFERNHPQVNVEVIDAANNAVAERVYDGRADIGIGLGPFDLEAFEPTFLFSDRLVAVVSAHHRLAAYSEVSWAEVGLEPIVCYHPSSHVYRMIDQALASQGISFTPRSTFTFRQSLFGWALSGNAVTILPSLSLRETMPSGLVQVPLIGPIISRQYFVFTRRRKALTSQAEALLNHLCASLVSRNQQ